MTGCIDTELYLQFDPADHCWEGGGRKRPHNSWRNGRPAQPFGVFTHLSLPVKPGVLN